MADGYIKGFRIGIGFDVHPFSKRRKLILGGVTIPYSRGLAGHSDADVLIHAIIDALFGAAGIGDIGTYFPDSDESLKNVSSLLLLKTAAENIRSLGFKVVNIDSTIIAQEPRLAPFIPDMITKIAEVLEIDERQVNVKGKTTENLGFIGRKEGIAAIATVLITC